MVQQFGHQLALPASESVKEEWRGERKRPGLAFERLDRHSTFRSRVGMGYAIDRTRLELCYRNREQF